MNVFVVKFFAYQTIADIHTDGQGQLSVFKNNFDVEFYIAIQL
jgi:hypothetical protein